MVYLVIILLTIISGLLIILYNLDEKQKKYFTENGIPFIPFSFPIIGNMWEYVAMKKHMIYIFQDIYNQFPDKKFYATYQFQKSFLFVKDLDLIKSITVKDFDSFQDHMSFVHKTTDTIFAGGLFQLRGQNWKDMRATLSPAFTSSKMRHMFNFVYECSKNTTDYLLKELEKPQNKDCGYVEVEMKDISMRFINDSISSSAFGLKVNSFSEPDNLLYKMGRKIANFNTLATLKILVTLLIPSLAKYLKISLLEKTPSNFFYNLITEAMTEREKNNIVRPDMIHLINEVKKGTLKHETSSNDKDAGFAIVEESSVGKAVVKREWKHIDLVSPIISFYVAAFDTSSTLLSFMAYELAIHPDIQKKLQEEIDEVASRNDGKLQYENLPYMKYMDMVTSETLRKWPPVISIDRNCVKPYKLPPVDDNTNNQFIIPVNTIIQIPVFAIHHDPQYYPDPEVFNPERFSDENKKNIKQYSYLPFGVGPRACIGSRFALMEVKAVMFSLLLNFDITTTPKSQVPVKFVQTSFNYTAEKGFRLGFKPRKSKFE